MSSLLRIVRTASILGRGVCVGSSRRNPNEALKMTQQNVFQQHQRWVSLSGSGRASLEWEKLMRAELSEKTKRFNYFLYFFFSFLFFSFFFFFFFFSFPLFLFLSPLLFS